MRSLEPGRLAVVLGSILVVAAVAAACGPSTPTPAPIGSPGGVRPSAGASPAPSAAPSAVAPSAGAVALDESLLAYLPANVAGVPVTSEPDAFATAAKDPDFAANVDSAAFAIAVDANDITSGVVAHLRPGRYSEALFRDWRDSYNEGTCAQSGGVAGNAQAELGGRLVYVTTCGNGLRTYHAYLGQRNVIVSLFSLGDHHFGEQLMSGLRP